MLVLFGLTTAFVIQPTHQGLELAARPRGQPPNRGFAPEIIKEKSAAKVEKERAAQAYEDAKAAGIPEYRVFVKGTEWKPVGCITVPRSESVDQAIFGNLDALNTAAVKVDPSLKDSDLAYGYNLACFPDDPVREARPPADSNPFSKWVKDLTNPLNA